FPVAVSMPHLGTSSAETIGGRYLKRIISTVCISGCVMEQIVYIGSRPRVAPACPVWNKGGSGIMQTALRLLDKDMMDKQRALDAALSQIERAFGKGSVMKLGSREAASDCDVIS